jgi:hypothetical protein
MHEARFTAGVSCLAVVAILFGCAGQGARYSEVVTQDKPVASGQTRIVLLRPSNRYDDYSLTRAVVSVNNKEIGRLAYGGFLFVDVDAGDVAIKASAKNPMYGVCELQMPAVPGETLYVDVGPRTANVVAGLVGSAAGAAAASDTVTHHGLKVVLVDKDMVQTAAASTVGGAAASAVESIGKECGGPFKLTPVTPSAALEQLDRLSWSR